MRDCRLACVNVEGGCVRRPGCVTAAGRRAEAPPPFTVWRQVLLFAMSIWLSYPLATVHADASAVAGRAILARNQDAVITVKVVIKASFGGREGTRETKNETIGTVVDPSGLTVISLSSIDPYSMVADLMRGRGRTEMRWETEVTDIKLLLADETELAAEVVLRDKDLDLAYVRPKEKPARPLRAVAMTTDVKPTQLDEVIVVSRLGKVASRVPCVSASRVQAIVEKPRPFYVLEQTTGSSGLGAPVFSLKGKPLGVLLLRTSRSQDDFAGGGSTRGMMAVVVPAKDVLDGAKEALAFQDPSDGAKSE